jgi:hypothetical protein
MNMQEITILLITFCIGLALLMAALKLAAWLLRPIFRAIQTSLDLSAVDVEETGPRTNALNTIHGCVVDARNWHCKRGKLHSEFWIKDECQREHRYKLDLDHPELRRGHQVTLIFYSGELAIIKNRSTGQEICIASSSLLSPLYPTYRKRKVFVSISVVIGLYTILRPESQAMADGLLMFTVVISILLAIIFFLKHVFTFSNRYEERQRAFSKFCAEEITKDQRRWSKKHPSPLSYEEIEEEEADINPTTGLPMKSASRDISGAKWGRVR